MKRIAIYLRVSTNAQDYERQRHEIEAYCKANRYSIKHTFEEKVSGAKDERPQFQSLCALTKDDIDAVVVWEISRLGRKLTTVIKAVEDFKEKGINVISLKEHFELFDSEGRVSPSSMIMMSLFSTMAVIERENIMERSRSGKLDKLNSGQLEYTDKAPYGYRIVNHKLEVFDDEAKEVRLIFNEYLNGFSQTDIAKAHNIHQSKVGRILINPVYMGKPYSKVLERTLTAPSIITEEQFYAAREICEQKTIKRSKKGTLKYSLKGKIICSDCGKVLSVKGESWGCHCYHSNIQRKFVDMANELILQRYIADRQDKETLDILKKRIANLNLKIRTLEGLKFDTLQKYEDAKAKVQVLMEIFTAEQLKKEVAEVKRLDKFLKDKTTELTLTIKKRDELMNSQKSNNDTIDDIVEKVIITVNDRATKTLTYFMKDERTYEVYIRPRKNIVEIKG